MGTALTERQLKELSRLTRRLVLCFDGDAAGEAATLRGMELAAAQGFELRVVTLPPGLDPADVAEGFEAQVARAETYLGYRVRLEIERAEDRQEAFVRVREVLSRAEDSPERRRGRCGSPPTGSTCRRRRRRGSRRQPVRRRDRARSRRVSWMRARGSSGTRSPASSGTAASCACSPSSARRTSTTRCTGRLVEALVVGGSGRRRSSSPLLAELDARAASEGIDEETAEQLLLRLRERRLRRELEGADEARLPDLQHALAKVRTAFREFV